MAITKLPNCLPQKLYQFTFPPEINKSVSPYQHCLIKLFSVCQFDTQKMLSCEVLMQSRFNYNRTSYCYSPISFFISSHEYNMVEKYISNCGNITNNLHKPKELTWVKYLIKLNVKPCVNGTAFGLSVEMKLKEVLCACLEDWHNFPCL